MTLLLLLLAQILDHMEWASGACRASRRDRQIRRLSLESGAQENLAVLHHHYPAFDPGMTTQNASLGIITEKKKPRGPQTAGSRPGGGASGSMSFTYRRASNQAPSRVQDRMSLKT